MKKNFEIFFLVFISPKYSESVRKCCNFWHVRFFALLKHLPYLVNVVNEQTLLKPALPFPLPHRCTISKELLFEGQVRIMSEKLEKFSFNRCIPKSTAYDQYQVGSNWHLPGPGRVTQSPHCTEVSVPYVGCWLGI